MFGYEESPHEVVGTVNATWMGKPTLVQLCRGTAPPQYLTLFATAVGMRREQLEEAIAGYTSKRYLGFGHNGERVILCYDKKNYPLLDEDWARLTRGEITRLEDLRFDERIQGDTGYYRDGNVCMY